MTARSNSDALLRETAAILKVRPEDVPTRVSTLTNEIAALAADIAAARQHLAANQDTP